MAELKRVLSYKVILLITINSMMGTGIFFLPALGVKIAGPASIISWIIFALLSVYIAMCFGELTSMFPTSGGVYEFSKHAFGRFPSFLVGWLNLITGNLTIAMLMLGAIRYLLPYKQSVPSIVISLVLILAFSIIAYRGMKLSATMLVTFSFITLGTLFAVMIPGLFRMNINNLQPFMPMGSLPILIAIFFIAETFFGWESPTFLAGEVKDGQRVMPKALVTGTIIIASISILFVFISMASLGWSQFANQIAPVSALGNLFYGALGMKIFTLLVYLAIIGSVADWVVSAPRLILSMAKDKLFISKFKAIHPKFGTPHKAIILQFFISSILVIVGAGSYYTLLNMLVPLLLLMYCIVMFSVIRLRIKQPDRTRFFKAPFGKVGPAIIILIFISLLIFWLSLDSHFIKTFIFAFSLIAMGIPLFFLLEVYHHPKTVRKIDDLLAYLTLYTERLMIPKKIRREIINLMGNIKGKSLFEFGCSVGTLTMHLAEEVGKNGKIYATDISERNINIAKKRLKKKNHNHVIAIYDKHHAIRVHPDVPMVDIIVGIAALGYVQKIRDVLHHMNKRLPIKGKICFVEYDKFFGIIPTVEWLSNDTKIKYFFREAGFSVDVVRKKSLFWENIYIFGKKYKEL